MAKYGSNSVIITVTDSGAVVRTMTSYVDTLNEMNIEALLQEGTAFGDAWVKQLATGIKRGNPVTMEGFFDDTATSGPDVVFKGIGDTRNVVLTWGGAKTTSFSAIIQNYVRRPVKNELTRYTVTLVPTGTVTEA